MFLNDYYYAIFYQSRENKSEFKVLLLQRPLGETVDKDKRCEITLNTSAREKLEMFMIAHPQIHFVGGEI